LYALTKRGCKVRAVYRNRAKIEATKHVFSYFEKSPGDLLDLIDWMEADINDIPSLELAFDGIKQVYHVAAIVSFDESRFDELKKVNIEGTANMVNLSLKFGVEKFCHVSSVAALGETADGTPIDEKTTWNPEADNHVYGITKYGAEVEVWRASQEGLPVVIVNPSVVLGAGFWNSGSGKLFSKISEGLSFYPGGTVGFVDVEDVVEAMIQLMESEVANESFVLSAENLDFKTVMHQISYHLYKKPPTVEAKPWMLRFLLPIDWLRHFLTGKQRLLFSSSIKSSGKVTNYNSSKFISTSNYSFRPVENTIEIICKRFLSDTSNKK
jgi:nucleoside-diphosphate-sugar epimerase